MKDLLAYMHPVVQVLVLLMAVATLRLGLALKNHRTGQRALAQWEGIYNRHTQLGLMLYQLSDRRLSPRHAEHALVPRAPTVSLTALFLWYAGSPALSWQGAIRAGA